jgi:TRAP-type mannitol/chloroaromatic compound transport system substrate-binding protein
MANSFTRRHVNFGLAAAGGMILAPRRARAADFTLRHQHGLPVDSPLHKRALEMWAAIRMETGGRVDVQITREGDASLDMLTKGDLAFMTLAGNGLASLMPAADVQATPYGFRNPAQVYRALDGELGDYLRGELRAKGLYAVPGGCFENGMHQITSATRPIRTAADIQGLKMRVPGSPAYQDFFKALGAQIVTTSLTRTYDALKAVEDLPAPLVRAHEAVALLGDAQVGVVGPRAHVHEGARHRRVEADLDTNHYETGIKVTDAELGAVRLKKDKFHGNWNYKISPRLD